MLFYDSNLMFSKDTITDLNGIADFQINQKSEEIFTIAKDLQQVRVWTYICYDKQKLMPPVDEIPVNVGHVNPNRHFFINNKKNLHVNLPLDQMLLNFEAELIAITSL